MSNKERLSKIERGLIPGERYTARVRAVSKLGVKSEWSDSVDFVTKSDASTPNPPTALTLKFERSTLLVEWNAPTTNTDGTLLVDLSHFKITISSGGSAATYTTADNFFLYTIEQNEKDFPSIESSLTVSVSAVDNTGIESSQITSSISNAAPLKPQTPIVDTNGTNMTVTMNPNAADKDIVSYRVERSTTPGSGFVEVGETDSKSFFTAGSPSTTYYFRYRVVDFFGQVSVYSDEASTSTGNLNTRHHDDLVGLNDDDHTLYSRADGTRAFTGEVEGITPTQTNSLATKGYVDSERTDHEGAADPHSQYVQRFGAANIVASSGASTSISFNTEVHQVTMDQNCTFSFTDLPTSGNQGSVTVIVKGAFTPTWPGSVVWDNGVQTPYADPAVYSFLTVDGGTTVFGFVAGVAMA